ncbi:S-layer homology domain-containing protein [Paenibacillus sp. AN1007]|uniref:S-layer homology domain-containing protein n=1 Tax=Paenibacillus sp. AN1007 TaxID=3151385 RepID=A0AAU8NBI1_9BACL
MYYKKLVSCLLVMVLVLQVVGVGGIANAASTPQELLNWERSNYDESNAETKINNIRNLLETGELLQLPEDYAGLSEDQKSEIARGMLLLLPLGYSYENEDQVGYVFDLVYHLIKLPKQIEPNKLQENISLVYSLLAEWPTYFPNIEQSEWVNDGNHFLSLTGADVKMFVSDILFYNLTFINFPSTTYFDSQLNFMRTKISSYKEINKAMDLTSMKESVNKLYGIYGFIQVHIDFPNKSEVLPYALDMSKMSTIQSDDTKKAELAQWMLDHKGEGYETISDVQKAFDAFFEPGLIKYNELKKVADRGNYNNYITEAIELLSDENFIATPNFKQLSAEDQKAIAVYMLKLDPPTSDGYANKEQVEYLVQLALKAVEFIHNIDGPNEITSLNELYTKQNDRKLYFDYPAADSLFYQVIDLYLQSSNIERDMTADILELRSKKNDPVSRVLSYIDSAVKDTPLINSKGQTTAEMNDSMSRLIQLQLDIKEYNISNSGSPVKSFPIDVSKMDGIKTDQEKLNALADHMIKERPSSEGYANFEQIQTAFDKFFTDDNGTDSLSVLNAAKRSGDIPAMRAAMEDPNLGITLPNRYGALSLQVRNFIANFLIKNVNKDFDNKGQVQYMIELGFLAQSVWEQNQFSTLRARLDLLAQQLVDGTLHFNDQRTQGLNRIGDEYLERSKLDRGVLAYKYLHAIAFERLEGEFKGDIVNPDIVLEHLSKPYTSFGESNTIPLMDEWLESAMNDQLKGEAFFNKYKFDRIGALDLSKRVELSPEGRMELAEWVLDDQHSYEDIGNLQYVFNRFFKAPKVQGDDINNKIIGLDSKMEISFDGKLNWIDLASAPILDFSGSKTVWVRYKAFSDELPSRAVKIVFTANGDSGNGSNPNPNPGSGSGGNTGGTSGSTGGGSSSPASSVPASTTKQEQLVVDVNGVNGMNLTKTPITRTTETNGKVKDLVKMTEAIAKQSVEKAKQLGTDTARIVIPDTKDAVSETRVEVPKTAVKDLSDGSLKLEISTENAVISIPTKSIAGFDQDLYFRIVPLKKEFERKEVEERAKKEQMIQQAAPNANVRVLARPVEIETNMQSREVTLTLPLGSSLPTETAARQQALNNLAVYIEHSDGSKELVRGKLVKLTNNSEGIEFTVTKFSTFTLVVVDGLNKESKANHPYIQGFGTDFRPDAFVTRAQMAAMLARNLSGETAAVEGTNFADVAAAHWAAGEIQQAQAAGIMNGLNDTVFAPEGSITRAQMATIAYRWMQQQTNDASAAGTASAASGAASFTDVAADLWAADAIAYVQSTGLMTGYNDGTFKPDGKLTRAEAVKVLNVLFKRTPLTAEVPSFSDVPAEHWAYADIEAAAQK